MLVPFALWNRTSFLAERVLGALNEGAMLVLLSIGHRTGLLRDLAGAGPLSSEEAARTAAPVIRAQAWLACQ